MSNLSDDHQAHMSHDPEFWSESGVMCVQSLVCDPKDSDNQHFLPQS